MEPLSLRRGQVNGMTLPEHGKREGSPLHHPMVWLAVFWGWAILLKHSETTREKLHTGPIQRGLR